jgi:hypothetical protein
VDNLKDNVGPLTMQLTNSSNSSFTTGCNLNGRSIDFGDSSSNSKDGSSDLNNSSSYSQNCIDMLGVAHLH